MAIEDLVLKFRAALDATERMPRAELAAYQSGLAAKLLAHAAAHTRAYGARLRGRRLSGACDADWLRLPLLTRADLQDAPEAVFADAVPPFCGPVETGSTSGSTGRPLTYRHERLLDVASAAQSDRAYDWWRLDGAKSLASFMSTYEPSMRERGSTRGGWRIGRPDSTRHVLELIADIGAQVDWLARVRPAYLFARGGAHLQALAEEAARRDAPLRFERILSTGTAMTPEARAAARRAFRCDVLDLYGASETGLIAAQCPDCGLMHSCDETMRVEVLRDDGAPAAEGELGRVVVTPLYAYAMPMIRYAIGDYAIRGPETAPCGRSLGSLRAVVGRARNLFRLADGRVLAPYANASGFRAFIDYRQIQLVQTALDRIEIRYVAASDRPVDAEGAAAFVRERFDPSLEAELVRVDHIPAGHGKFEETLSILAP